MSYPVRDVVLPSDLVGASNGRLPAAALVDITLPGWGTGPRLHRHAARAFKALAAEVLRRFGATLTCTHPADTYRSYEIQLRTFLGRYVTHDTGRSSKWWNGTRYWLLPGYAMAATPGASNHGWGLAIDACYWDGSRTVGIGARNDVFSWMLANADDYGFSWEAQSEPWHIRYFTGDRIPQAVLDFEHDRPPEPPKVDMVTITGGKAVLRPEDRAALRDDPQGSQDVKLCQILCNGLLTADLAIDGDYGPKTVAAATLYQRAARIDPDGVWGPATWRAVLALD